MPVQRVSKPFKDISATFQTNPLNSDLIALKNENAISRSIRNLILTQPGDKPFQPDLGSRVSRSLFELLDFGTATIIKKEIDITIKNFEPRVEINTIEVTPEYDNNGYNVLISYFIVGQPRTPVQLEFILQATR